MATLPAKPMSGLSKTGVVPQDFARAVAAFIATAGSITAPLMRALRKTTWVDDRNNFIQNPI
jgi:hypothetical protein